MWIGRWGSTTVRRYIAEAADGQAPAAAQAATSTSCSSSSTLAITNVVGSCVGVRTIPEGDAYLRTVPASLESFVRQIAEETAMRAFSLAQALKDAAEADSTGAVR